MKRLWTIFLLAMAMAVLSWPDAPQAVQAVQAQQKAKDPTPDVPSVTLPATVQIDAPGLIVIRATAINADDVRYYPLSPGIQTFPPDIIAPNPSVFLGLALKEGVYIIGAVPAKDVGGKAKIGEAVRVTVTVGTPIPPPPPTDPLVQAVQTAYATCPDPAKASNIGLVAKVYAQAATLVANTQYATWADFEAAVVAYGTSLNLPTSAVPNVAAAIKASNTAVLPNSTTPTNTLTTADRTAAAAQYNRVAAALGAVKTFRATKGDK